jgi:antitoxin MazE
LRATIQKWGNSLAVRIPKAFAEETRLRQGSEIEISLADGNVVLAPLRKYPIKLSELLERVSPESLHEHVEWGRPKGRETW